MGKKPTVPAYLPHFWTKEIIALGAWGKLSPEVVCCVYNFTVKPLTPVFRF